MYSEKHFIQSHKVTEQNKNGRKPIRKQQRDLRPSEGKPFKVVGLFERRSREIDTGRQEEDELFGRD